MLLVVTHTDYTFAHANLGILEMDTIVQVHSIISKALRFFSTLIIVFSLLSLLFIHMDSQC